MPSLMADKNVISNEISIRVLFIKLVQNLTKSNCRMVRCRYLKTKFCIIIYDQLIDYKSGHILGSLLLEARQVKLDFII